MDHRPEFDEDLAGAERAPDDVDRFTEVNLGYIEDVLDALAWTRRSEDQMFEEEDGHHPGPIPRIRTSR